jgi:carboxylesterase type B
MSDELQAWYDDFSAAMQAGGLTSTDITRLRSTYQDLADKALQARDEIAAITDYDITSSQSSQSKGVAGMTSTQADEVNGRFTALQIAGEAIRSQVEAQSVTLNAINADTQQLRYNAAQIAQNIAQSVEIQQSSASTLARIEQHTSNLPAMLAALNDINKNTKNL